MTTVHCKRDTFDVYIGRPSRFGNPCKINEPCPVCGHEAHNRAGAIACYERYARDKVFTDPTWFADVVALRGKRLGCWCSPLPCHGDVLARLADEWSRSPVYAMITGHRPDKLGGYSPAVEARVRALLRPVLTWYKEHAAASGYRLEVISGMALGADQWWAAEAMDLDVFVHAFVPFAGQESRWPDASQRAYRALLHRCVSVTVCSAGGYSASAMQTRDEQMVDRAHWHVALWDGSSGGTANTVRYMRRQGVAPEIIHPWNAP